MKALIIIVYASPFFDPIQIPVATMDICMEQQIAYAKRHKNSWIECIEVSK